MSDSLPETKPPKRKFHVTPLMLLVAIVVIAAVVVAEFVFVWYPGMQQPAIALTGATYVASGCGASGPFYVVYTWSFNLTNSGSANGLATVTFYVDGTSVGETQFLVPRGATVAEVASVHGATRTGSPCPAETPTLAVTAVAKA